MFPASISCVIVADGATDISITIHDNTLIKTHIDFLLDTATVFNGVGWKESSSSMCRFIFNVYFRSARNIIVIA